MLRALMCWSRLQRHKKWHADANADVGIAGWRCRSTKICGSTGTCRSGTRVGASTSLVGFVALGHADVLCGGMDLYDFMNFFIVYCGLLGVLGLVD
jgi:hypothetical protein